MSSFHCYRLLFFTPIELEIWETLQIVDNRCMSVGDLYKNISIAFEDISRNDFQEIYDRFIRYGLIDDAGCLVADVDNFLIIKIESREKVEVQRFYIDIIEDICAMNWQPNKAHNFSHNLKNYLINKFQLDSTTPKPKTIFCKLSSYDSRVTSTAWGIIWKREGKIYIAWPGFTSREFVVIPGDPRSVNGRKGVSIPHNNRTSAPEPEIVSYPVQNDEIVQQSVEEKVLQDMTLDELQNLVNDIQIQKRNLNDKMTEVLQCIFTRITVLDKDAKDRDALIDKLIKDIRKLR